MKQWLNFERSNITKQNKKHCKCLSIIRCFVCILFFSPSPFLDTGKTKYFRRSEFCYSTWFHVKLKRRLHPQRFFGMTSSCYSTPKIRELGSCWKLDWTERRLQSFLSLPRLIGFWSNPSEYHLTLTPIFAFTSAPTTPSAAKYVHTHLLMNSPHWGGQTGVYTSRFSIPATKRQQRGGNDPATTAVMMESVGGVLVVS